MEALKLSLTTIIFVLIFIAPGAIFHYTVTRWVFTSGRYNNSKIASFISAVLISIGMLILCDRPVIKKRIIEPVVNSKAFHKFVSHNDKLIDNLKNAKMFDLTLSVFSDNNSKPHHVTISQCNQCANISESSPKEIVDNKQDIYFLIATGIFLMLFSIASSLLVSLFLSILENFILNSYLSYLALYFAYLIKIIALKIDIKPNLSPIKKIFSLQINPKLKKFLETIFIIAFVIILALAVISLFIAALLLILIIVISYLISTLFFFTLYKVLNLFKHPLHETLFKYQVEFRTPIVEIRTKENYLLKGILKSFSPLSSQELYTITISSVVQYHLQNPKKSMHFSRKTRSLYEFENPQSELTIFSSNILDFNVWYLSVLDETWKFEINKLEDIKNQLWYFKILINQNKLAFSAKNLDVKVNYKLAFQFARELINLITEEYSNKAPFFLSPLYKIKRKELFVVIMLNVKKVSFQIKGSNLPPSVIAELNQERDQLLIYVKGLK